MIIDFRQGIVSYDFTTSPPIPLVPSNGGFNVNLVVGNAPITLTVAQATNNYTFQENSTVTNAWTVPSTTNTYWLYWDFNTQSLVRTFGYTTLQPIAQPNTPTNPQTGQMWYNTSTFRNYVYSGGGWTEVLRVLAAEYIPSAPAAFQFVSLSDQSPLPSGYPNLTGTQIGVNQVNVASGFPVFNGNGAPIQRGDGTYLTTETVTFVQGAAVTGVRLESNVYTASSSDVTTIPAYAVIAAQSNGTWQLGSYEQTNGTAIAMAIQNIPAGGSGAVCLEGTITNPLWNWSNNIGDLLWISDTSPGQLVTIDPYLSNPIANPIKQTPVARVLSTDTIIFLQGIGTTGPQGPPGQSAGNIVPATSTRQGVVYLSTDSGQFTPLTNVVIAEGDPRLTNARTALSSSVLAATNITVAPDAPSGTNQPNVQLQLQALGNTKLNLSGGTMTGNLILNVDPTTNFQAATKHYVDTNFYSLDSSLLPLSGGTMTGNLILNANPTIPLQAATKSYVDNIAQGITFQAAVTAASTADVGASYAGSPNYTLTANTNGVFTIDGVQPSVGTRVLIKNQTVASQNGVYDVTSTGSISTPFVLTRDAAEVPPNTLVSGTFVFVNTGTTQNSTGWILSTPNPITLDTTSLTFVQFSSAANITSGAITTALGYTPVGPFTVTGSSGLAVAGSPVSGGSPSGVTLTLSAELQGLNGLATAGTYGLVQRTGIGTYVAQSLTSSQVTTALGYIPLATAAINTSAPLTGGGTLTSSGLTLGIAPFAGSAPGAVPTSPGGTTQFLRADGNWAVPPTGGGGGGGGVTSVELATTTGPGLTFSGTNPITTSGTINVNLNAELQGLAGLSTTGYVQRTGTGTYVVNTGSLSETIFAAASQTIVNFTGITTTAKTAFPAGRSYVQVFLNGVLQREDNATGTGYGTNPSGSFYVSGTAQITFFSGLSLNDEITAYQLP